MREALTTPGRRRTLRRQVAVGVLSALGFALTAPATATGEVDGLWYVEDLDLTTAHQSATGEGITVAILDTLINPDVPELADADLVIPEDSLCPELLTQAEGDMVPSVSASGRALHGTHMAMLVAGDGTGHAGAPGVQGVAPGATVHYYAMADRDGGDCVGEDNTGGMPTGVDQAVADGADIISISWSDAGTLQPERTLIEPVTRALRAGVIVVAGTPNDGSTTHIGYPAQFNGVVTVSAYGPDGELTPGQSAAHPTLDVVAPGNTILTPDPDDNWRSTDVTDGSSNATAITAGALALVWSAHPDATANQIIQTLVRHTQSAGGDLNRHDDWWGYGKLSITNMLAADPTTYPDENPLLSDHPDAGPPTLADVLGTRADPEAQGDTAPATAPTEGEQRATPAEDATPGGLPTAALVIVGVVGLALLVGALVTAAALARRRAGNA